MDVLELDGSEGEGGGQIARTALFLSLLLGRPFTLRRIRAGRPKPGLKAQHVAIVRLLAEMTGSRCEGAVVGSAEITFLPGQLRAGSWRADVGTAGSIPLVLQTILPVAIATPGTTVVEVTGGTDVPFAPTIDWVRNAYVPYVAPLAEVRVDVLRRGFAPQGGGRVRLEVRSEAPASHEELRAFVRSRLGSRRIEQGRIVHVGGSSVVAASLGRTIAARQALAAHAQLLGIGPPPQVDLMDVESDGPGSSLTCWLVDDKGNHLASDRLGHPKASAESVGKVAAANLVEDWKLGGTVDRHLGDHVVPWVALGAGAVRVPEMTPHLRTNAWVCNRFLGEWAVRVDRNLVR